MSFDPTDEIFDEAYRESLPDQQITDVEQVNEEVERLKRHLDENSTAILCESMELLIRTKQIQRQLDLLEMIMESE